MKIIIQYDDGLPFASYRMDSENAALWRTLFEDTANQTGELAGTAGAAQALAFAEDLINATHAAESDLGVAEGAKRGREEQNNRSAEATEPPLDSGRVDVGAGGTVVGSLRAAQLSSTSPIQGEPIEPKVSEVAEEVEEVVTESHLNELQAPTSDGDVQSWPTQPTPPTTKRSLRGILGFPYRVVRGDAGLALTYWLYGVVGTSVLAMLVRHLGSTPALAVVVVYTILVWIGVWNAASRYEGKKIWRWLAKTMVVLAIVAMVLIAIVVLGVLPNIGPSEFNWETLLFSD